MSATAKKWLAVTVGLIAFIVLVILAIFLTQDSRSQHDSTESTPVQLSIDLPRDFKVGLIYSLTEDPNVETSWLDAAEGAQVAAYRIDPKGEDIAFYTQNDHGTEDGAQRAVDALTSEGVSGIIVATSGAHVQTIADAASAKKVPTIFLYDGDVNGESSWTFAPSSKRNFDALATALTEHSYTNPIVFDSEENLSDLTSVKYYPFDVSTDLAELAQEVAGLLEAGTHADSIVISGNSAAQLALIQELQTRAITLPVLLTSQAAAPEFSEGLVDFGINDGNFETVGVQSVDILALESDSAGERAASFFTAIRLMNDSSRMNLLNELPFHDVISNADGLSHDALVSLAHAADNAGSSDAEKVLAALKGANLTGQDGLVTGSLNFTQTTPNADLLGVVRMTMQSPGLRDGSEASTYWFAE